MTKFHLSVLFSVVCSWLIVLEPAVWPAHASAQEVDAQKIAAKDGGSAAMMSSKFVPGDAMGMVSLDTSHA